MRKFFRFITTLTIITFSLPGRAEEATSGQIQTLIQKSGLSAQLEQLPQILEMGLNQSRQKNKESLAPEEFEMLKNAMIVSYDPAILQKSVSDYILVKISKEEIDQILSWLDSPIGRKIIKLEEDTATPEGEEKMENMSEELYKDEDRIALVQELDEAIRGSESNVEMVLSIQYAMAVSMAIAIDPGNQDLLDNVMKRVMAGRRQMTEVVRESTLKNYLYTYHTLQPGEIRQYIEFAKTAYGMKYFQVITESLSKGIIEASRNVGKIFGQSLKKAKEETREEKKDQAVDSKEP